MTSPRNPKPRSADRDDTSRRIAAPHVPADLPPVLTVGETASLLRVDRKTIYAMIERNKLPGVRKIVRCLRLSRDALLSWLGDANTRTAQE